MIHYRKYEFDTLPEILQPIKDENGEIIKKHSIENADVVIHRPFNLKDAVLDPETFEILEPAIPGTKIPVDILYKNGAEPLPELEPYKVTPRKYEATILGQDKEYLKTL